MMNDVLEGQARMKEEGDEREKKGYV